MKFGEALEAIRLGKKVARAGWQAGAYLFLIEAKQDIALSGVADHYPEGVTMHPWIAYKEPGLCVPWTPNTQELMTEDWQEIV